MSKKNTDAERFRFLAGCGDDDGPVVYSFIGQADSYFDYLGPVLRKRVGDKAFYAADCNIDPTDDDKLAAFRRMVDDAMAADAKRKSSVEASK